MRNRNSHRQQHEKCDVDNEFKRVTKEQFLNDYTDTLPPVVNYDKK